MVSLLRRPSAWIPLVLSLAMLGVFALYFIGVIPPDPTGDEGIGAHLFQIWLVLEVFTIAFFAVKWLSSDTKNTLSILALQICAVFALCFPVWYLHL